MSFSLPRSEREPVDAVAEATEPALAQAVRSAELASLAPSRLRRLARQRHLRYHEALIRQEMRRLAHATDRR